MMAANDDPARLEPLPGFDWARVKWGAPDARRTEHCSYCGAALDDDSVPLILWSATGWCAEFCDGCKETHWGFTIVREPDFGDDDGC
jgi:hypothetical protein